LKLKPANKTRVWKNRIEIIKYATDQVGLNLIRNWNKFLFS
jgi:hypothetical protein